MNENKFNIEWHSIVRDLIRNAWVIICAVLVGLMGSYIARHSFYSPVYTSNATLIVNSAAGKANAYSSLSESSEIAAIYSEVFIQPSMERKVCEYLHQESFDGEINSRISEGTNVLELSVTSSNPETAYKELKAIIEVYPELTTSLFRNGAVSVLRMPTISKSPANAMTSANRMKIIAIAVFLSSAMIVVLSVLRDTIKDEKTFNEKVDAKLLGTIPHQSKRDEVRRLFKRKKQGLLIHESAFTSLQFTENFGKIATKLEYMRRTKGTKVFSITSVAENEGKSTIASNIAISLASRGNRVVIVDLDGKKPALHKLFELKYIPNSELGNLLSKKIASKDFKLRKYKNISLYIAANTKGHKDYHTWIEENLAKGFISALKKTADYVIVDTAPVSADSAVTAISKFCDATIMVVRTDSVYAPIINDTLLTLSNTGANVIGCVLNDVYGEFSLFGQFGTDESGYSHYSKYGKYDKYSKYSKYGSYGKYSNYGSKRYSRYSSYNKYGKYSEFGYSPSGGFTPPVVDDGEKLPFLVEDVPVKDKKDGGIL